MLYENWNLLGITKKNISSHAQEKQGLDTSLGFFSKLAVSTPSFYMGVPSPRGGLSTVCCSLFFYFNFQEL